jgi:hypothetical protein
MQAYIANRIRVRIDTKIEVSNSVFWARGRSCAIAHLRAHCNHVVGASEYERRRARTAGSSGILDAFPTSFIGLVRNIATIEEGAPELRTPAPKLNTTYADSHEAPGC